LLSLPHEIFDNILASLGKDDLRNMRLICHHISQPATRRLFRTLRLVPVSKSIEHFNRILSEKAGLRGYVREVTIQTFPTLDWTPPESGYDNVYNPYYKWQAPEAWFTAISQLHSFSNLTSILLNFTNMCSSPTVLDDLGGEKDIPEGVEKRQTILDATFHAMSSCNSLNEAKIHSLTIKNLQNFRFEIVEDLFSNATKELREFHAYICTESNGSKRFTQYPDNQSFWPYFTEEWLTPLSAQLKSLSLYCDTQWGLFPSIDCMRDLHFSELESLSLGYRAFTYDWELEWILEHVSLRSLRLQECGIVCIVDVDPLETPFTYIDRTGLIDVTTDTLPGNNDILEYRTRWTDYFKSLQLLPLLTDFYFGCLAPDNVWPNHCIGGEFDDRVKLGQNLHTKRFFAFQNGWVEPMWIKDMDEGRNMWDDCFITAEEEGEMQLPQPLQDEEYLVEEKEVFKQLCAIVAARRKH